MISIKLLLLAVLVLVACSTSLAQKGPSLYSGKSPTGLSALSGKGPSAPTLKSSNILAGPTRLSKKAKSPSGISRGSKLTTGIVVVNGVAVLLPNLKSAKSAKRRA